MIDELHVPERSAFHDNAVFPRLFSLANATLDAGMLETAVSSLREMPSTWQQIAVAPNARFCGRNAWQHRYVSDGISLCPDDRLIANFGVNAGASACRRDDQGVMGLINYDRLLATLISREQDFANELLSLSQQEHACCESDDSERLIEIVAQRKEVMSAWQTHHEQTLAVAHSARMSDGSIKAELRNALIRLNETIAAIQNQDQLSLQKLTQKTSPDIDRMQSMNQGSHWLQSLNPSVQSFAYDSRQ